MRVWRTIGRVSVSVAVLSVLMAAGSLVMNAEGRFLGFMAWADIELTLYGSRR